MKTIKLNNMTIELSEEERQDLLEQLEGNKPMRFRVIENTSDIEKYDVGNELELKEGNPLYYCIWNNDKSDYWSFNKKTLCIPFNFGACIRLEKVEEDEEEKPNTILSDEMKELERRMAVLRVKQYINDNGLEFTPDWGDRAQDKYVSFYDYDNEQLDWCSDTPYNLGIEFYFKSINDVNQVNRACEKDMKLILRVKE